MKTLNAQRYGPAVLGILAASGALGLLLGRYFSLGSFHDDAIYWLLSKSLRLGHYYLACDPAHTPMNYMPGYPIFLAALAWGGAAIAQGLSWALTLASLWMAWKILQKTSPSPLWPLAWLAFQPVTLRYACTVLSEPLFVFLTVLCFHLYSRGPSGKPSRDLPLALAAGFACWVRPGGFILGAALLADAILRKNFRQGAALAAALLAFQGTSMWMYGALGEGLGAHFSQWRFVQRAPMGGSIFQSAGQNLGYYKDFLVYSVIFPLGKWKSFLDLWGVLDGSIQALALGLLLAGWGSSFKDGNRPLALFFLFYAPLLVFWQRPDPRYVMPLIFPMVVFLARALEDARAWKASLTPAARGLALAGICLGAASGLRGAVLTARGERHPMPVKTHAWIRENLDKGAVVASETFATVYLATGRRGVGFPRTYDWEEFHRYLVSKGVTHILAPEEVEAPARPDTNDWSPQVRLMLTQRSRYKPIKGFQEDGMSLYEIDLSSNVFVEADAWYRQGLSWFNRREWDKAAECFQLALHKDPAFTSALDRLSYVFFQKGNPVEALNLLGRALKVWPENPEVLLHRYHVARDPVDLEKARAISRRHGIWPLFWQIRRQV